MSDNTAARFRFTRELSPTPKGRQLGLPSSGTLASVDIACTAWLLKRGILGNTGGFGTRKKQEPSK